MAPPPSKAAPKASPPSCAIPARKVTDIPGIGKGLAFVIQDIEQRRSCERRDELLTRFPAASLEFLKIQGLGPKSIALLFEHFRVGSIDELEQLCVDQKLRDLPRMGAKLEEKSTSLHRAIPPPYRTFPAEFRRPGGIGIERGH